MSRGAIKLNPKSGFVQVELTGAGIDLLNWAAYAKLRDYKTDSLPTVQGLKHRKGV
jgi:hypothetical protein